MIQSIFQLISSDELVLKILPGLPNIMNRTKDIKETKSSCILIKECQLLYKYYDY